MTPDLSVRPSDGNGSAPATDYPPTFTENCNALRRTCARAISPDQAPRQSAGDESSDTLLGNRVPVSKPIRITRSRYSCLSSAGKKTSIRDAENRERPRWFFARVQAELLPPAHPQRVERQERFERLRRTRPRGERSAAIERLGRLVPASACY